ncbi:hypothetical protein QNJ39_10955 [Macrococcus caseolyticus]|uniref:hypothetical protein n=1 Tax=Macrococcoides caseolyticum TaxID=69966 RepID=UPI0024BC7AD9|nr:hypothetical protein [Macrococcus caseolyticus]MDJ1092103.1 hypothetical protein [Macrococcus caseolyticus]
MKLTKNQQEILISKLNDLWINDKRCNICSNNQWNLSDILFETREFQGGNMVIGGDSSVMVYIPATCERCGNTHFFNPIVLGIDVNNGE